MKDSLKRKLGNSVIKREIAVISGRFSPSKSSSPTNEKSENFPTIRNVVQPQTVITSIEKPKNINYLRYSTNPDHYDKRLFGFPPDTTTRSSVKRYSPYRHSSMSIEQACENEERINNSVLSHYET